MAKQLTVHNATINTAVVEVKTLTISGKQVTLAVFRQLREERLIAHDGTLNGQPWGYVNYHPDKCDNGPAHRHFVWQRGDELLRSRVDAKPEFDDPQSPKHLFSPKAAASYVTAQFRDWLVGQRKTEPPLMPHPRRSGYEPSKDLGKIFGIPVVGVCSTTALEAERAGSYVLDTKRALDAAERRGMTDTSHFTGQLAKHQQVYDQLLAQLDAEIGAFGTSPGQLTEAVTAAAKAEDWRRQRQRAVRAELAELPQLFIAV